MLEVQEKTFLPIFRCEANGAIILNSVEKPEAKVVHKPVERVIFHGILMTKEEARTWDSK